MTSTTQQTAWPEGVIARALTIGGATVDVIDDATDNRPHYQSISHEITAACTGASCHKHWRGVSLTFAPDMDLAESEEYQWAIAECQSWARRHATTCRWLPRP